ncbi:MAG: cupin domain-containing protein [Acidimicrobiia bacterium]
MSDTNTEPVRTHIIDLDDVEGFSIADIAGDDEQGRIMIEAFGSALFTKPIVRTPQLSVFHESAGPGERVKPHRHGTYQLNYVLKGELIFGNQHVKAGMSYFTPDELYSWRTGDEGAEWIEIHAGEPGIYFDRPEH